ncbi:MAG: DivIVA domain-containing protein [Actinomycetota bacterium]|nr:DivIVA domain-containing protein [Actinomycetota bacterium]
MEVSPKTLREVEFREKMRGYHPEDVDQFLEQVAAGIEVLQDRLRQAVERAQRAEAAASESGGTDETLRKTLVLAQRTADMAVQEAREQASRILGSAEQQAQSIIAEAEERGRRTLEETIAECKAELGRLESSRTQAQQDVETLQRWLDEHKEHLRATLTEALSAVDRAGVLWPAPTSRGADLGRRTQAPMAGPAANLRPEGDQRSEVPVDSGPETQFWAPGEPQPAHAGPGPQAAGDPLGPGGAGGAVSPGPPAGAGPVGSFGPAAAGEVGPVGPGHAGGAPAGPNGGGAHIQAPEAGGIGRDDQALDDFFDDHGDIDDERRFGGRLRRRR